MIIYCCKIDSALLTTQYKTKPVNWSLLGRDVQYMLRASDAFNALKRQEDRTRDESRLGAGLKALLRTLRGRG